MAVATDVSLVGIRDRGTSIDLTWADGFDGEYHYLWLRDNCGCSVCRHPDAVERTFDLLKIPLNIRPTESAVVNATDLRLVWDDDRHESVYRGEWLRGHRYSKGRVPTPVNERGETTITEGLSVQSTDYHSVLESNGALLDLCQQMQTNPVLLISNVPNNGGEVVRLASKIGHPWTHSKGALFDIRARDNPVSTAYTNLPLVLHTDLPSRHAPPRYQLMHCLQQSDEGGDSVVADGFAVANELLRSAPEAFNILTTTDVEFRYVDADSDYRHRGPIISLASGSQKIQRIRFNTFLQSPLSSKFERMPLLYRAYRLFLELAQSPRFCLHRRLEPGEVICLDNYRVLHARDAFRSTSRERWLQVCYLDEDEVESRIRVLQRDL